MSGLQWDAMTTVGIIVRSHGRRGEVVVISETDFGVERFAIGATVYLRRLLGADAGTLEPKVVLSSREWQGRWIVGFVGVGSIDDAETLRGFELRIPAEDRRALGADTYYVEDLAGCQVTTIGGDELGVVERVVFGSGPPLLVVIGTRGEVLVPLAEAICRQVDVVAKRIVIDPPGGLVELNAR